ncbi:ATPase [Sphingomicrobium astaxanthinifaciens]|uniref:ATPase n=1 Tax=Sphingomicrobium astaxanthinifaciens TaxID=1227949 RepID=UPI001FCC615F|nr:ATPase [Sphingomicrobium astaxanthinifaciens]MCJ7421734.1 ATPase [Sphingomicrobium astaxanthinifaciens]
MLRHLPLLAAATAALIGAPGAAHADVIAATTNSFHIRHEVPLVVPAARAFDLLARPGDWWSDAHSYSGAAANMRLELRPGGCFCEIWDAGAVEHLRVVAVTPGEQVVLAGGLGPLLYAPASGTMVWKVEPGGTGAILTIDYKVTGFAANDAAEWSSRVDAVLAEQVMRFRAAAAAMPRR